MILDTLLKIEAVLAGAVSANQPVAQVDFVDFNKSGLPTTPAPFRVALNDANDVTILAAPQLPNIARECLRISIYNRDTASATVTVKTDDATTERILIRTTLATLETLNFEKARGWYVLDANGNEKTAVSGGTKDTLATTVTGYASDPAITLRITKQDDVVTLTVPTFTGTSDATSKATADALATNYRPAATVNFPIFAVDNGGTQTAAIATLATSGILTFHPTAAAGNWTASGTATVGRAQVTYHV